MAKKGREQKKQAASKHVTTRRLARWQREKRRQRITLLSGIVIIAVVIGIIIGGVIATSASDWLSKVETDSGTVTIKKADYADEFKFYIAGVYNSSTMTNESPLITIENNLLIEDGSKAAGLSVTESEVTNIIHDMFETANESITEADFQEQYQSMLDNMGLSDKEFREVIMNQLLSEKLLESYIDQTPTSGEQAALEQITLFNESEADNVAQRWRDGEEFETLSAEYSDYSNSGWVAVGALDDSIRDVISTIEIGNVSDPISIGNTSDDTSSSVAYYVIIKVLDWKDDVIPDSLRQSWGYNEFSSWYYQAYADKVERNPELDLAEVYAWAVKELQ